MFGGRYTKDGYNNNPRRIELKTTIVNVEYYWIYK